MRDRLRAAWGTVRSGIEVDWEWMARFWDEDRATSAYDLDQRTWDDLDLSTVLANIDHTETSLGLWQFYRRVRSGDAWSDTPWLDSVASRCESDPTLREEIGILLAAAGRPLGRGIEVLFRPDAIRDRWWYWFFPLLAGSMLTVIIATVFEPGALVLALPLVVLNMAARMLTAWQVPGLLSPMRQLTPLITLAERLHQMESISLVSPVTVNEITALRPLRRIGGWVSRNPLTSNELLVSMQEYLNLLFLLDANALLFGARHLRAHHDLLRRTAEWIGGIDLARGVASLRAEPRGWSIPAWQTGRETTIIGAWHPLLPSPVRNDASWQAGRGLIITGANMSGKSTYLRTIGIAAVLARAINLCPAESWQGAPHRVRSLIGRSDDLLAGKSYYQVEAEGVVGMMAEVRDRQPTLFLLDELLRGTNTVERLAAGEAVLRELLAHPPEESSHAVLVATHDGELVQLLADRYEPWHFQETITASGLHFDFRRHPGPATTRTAIALLASCGAPSAVIERATIRAHELDGHAPPIP
ncbi:MAG: hypothetical protein U0974_05090 [Gemmatimonadales bacterium]|nr:hypothetical protein [Gemmatimonadales bacterium]MDZ4389084.1 hypothetical protein [Gemmatimonadales bacterium]